eukprot:2520302-Pyramimonas_sp.AAC.1
MGAQHSRNNERGKCRGRRNAGLLVGLCRAQPMSTSLNAYGSRGTVNLLSPIGAPHPLSQGS